MTENPKKEKPENFNIKIRKSLKLEFSVAVELEGFDMSGVIRNFMIRTVREVRERNPKAFDEALAKARHEAEENVATKRTRGKGQLMEVKPSKDKEDDFVEYDLQELYRTVHSKGFEVDYATIQGVIVGDINDVEPALEAAILNAAGISRTENAKEGTNGK